MVLEQRHELLLGQAEDRATLAPAGSTPAPCEECALGYDAEMLGTLFFVCVCDRVLSLSSRIKI